MTIRFRFLILLISAVILPVTLVAILAAYEFRVSAIDSFKESSLSEIQKIDQTFSQYLSGLAEDVKFLASSDALKALDDSRAFSALAFHVDFLLFHTPSG